MRPIVKRVWSSRDLFSRTYTSLQAQQLFNAVLHIPVMKDEVLKHLNLRTGQVFVDMTFGMGGHSKFILGNVPQVKGFFLDRDPYCFEFMEQLKHRFRYDGHSITPLVGKFSDLPGLCSTNSLEPQSVDAILMDLGVSSVQLDDKHRGFSIKHDAPLDMRMNPKQDETPTAADVLNSLSAAELAQIFKIYGEEKFSRRIANAIVDFRTERGQLKTTAQLAAIVESIVPTLQHTNGHRGSYTFVHVATRVFQALRIFVNDELNELCTGLQIAEQLLKPGGRLVVISFHSLEDRLVKWTFNQPRDNPSISCSEHLVRRSHMDCIAVTKRSQLIDQLDLEVDRSNIGVRIWLPIAGPLMPSDAEVDANPRSRSAKLRVGQKL